MALPTTAAPTRPAPMPQPRPLASAGVVVAMLPVTARAASARAAIPVLIDMKNSIRLKAAPCGPRASWTERLGFRFESGDRNLGAPVFSNYNSCLSGAASAGRAARKRCRIEFIDIGEQFAERAGAVIEQAFALFRGGQRRIAGGAAWMKVLGLPGERRRPVRRKPAIILLHRNAGRTEIGDLVLAHVLRIARQHDRGLDRAAMDAVTQFLR